MTQPLPDHEPRCPGVKITLEVPVSFGLATAAALPECRNCLRRTLGASLGGPAPTMQPPIYVIMSKITTAESPTCPSRITP